MSNSLNSDQAQHFVGPDQSPNCLQWLVADDEKVSTGRLRVNSFFPEKIPEILNVEYFSLVPGKSCLLQELERSMREVGKFI